MRHLSFDRLLQGGDRRSIGKSNHVAAAALRNPKRSGELIACLWSDDPVVRMRAADAAEKISVKRPKQLVPFRAELLGLSEEAAQPELRWHLALMLPRLGLTAAQRHRLNSTLLRYLTDRSSLVKTCALQGMADLAKGDAALERELIDRLESTTRNGTSAMQARSRILLKQFFKANVSQS
jgi:hypothetical protein